MRAPVRLRPGVSRRVAPQCQTERPDPPRSTKRISPSMTQPAPRDPPLRQPSRLALARSWALDLGRPASRRYQRSGDKHHCRGGPARAFPARRRRVSSSNSPITTTTRMSTIKRKTIPAMRRSTANDPSSAHIAGRCGCLRGCRTRRQGHRRALERGLLVPEWVGKRSSLAAIMTHPTARGEDHLGPRSGMEAALSPVFGPTACIPRVRGL